MPDKLKKGWRSWRFDQMAYMVNDRIDDPSEANVEHYVGLEHLDSDSLTIRRWGSPSDVEATKLCFRKGDIIFGRRRVYQRKLAVAPFDGICSAHAMVLRPKTDVVLPEYLPFFMQSDLFMERAKQISVGSLSPTINWKTLAAEEFALPPLDEQRRMAEVLGAVNRVQEKTAALSVDALIILRATTEKLCWDANWPQEPVRTIADSLRGGFRDGDWIESKDQAPSGIRLLQLADIGESVFLNKSRRYISEKTFERLSCTEVKTGDLLIARMADPIGRTCAVPQLEERCITAVDCCIVTINETAHDARYWLYVLNSPSWTRLVEAGAAGSTRSRISRTNLEMIGVPVPQLKEQRRIAEHLTAIANSNSQIQNRLLAMREMHRDLLFSTIGGAS